MAQARGYLAPPLHADAYRRQIAAGPAAASLHREGKRIVMRWLEAAQPPIPPAIAEAVLGNERCATDKERSKRAIVRWLKAAHPSIWPSVAQGALTESYAPRVVIERLHCMHRHYNRTPKVGQ